MVLCTLSKCWPDLVPGVCNGGFYQLSQLEDSAERFLAPLSAWNKTSSANPTAMWEVYLTHVSASTFLVEELSGFTICQSHKVITGWDLYKTLLFYISQESMDNKFLSKNIRCRRCFLCCSKNTVRGVTLTLHKKLFTHFLKIVPLGAGIFTS